MSSLVQQLVSALTPQRPVASHLAPRAQAVAPSQPRAPSDGVDVSLSPAALAHLAALTPETTPFKTPKAAEDGETLFRRIGELLDQVF